MKPPRVLDYRGPSAPETPVNRRAVFFPFHWIALAFGSISVIGFLAFAAWPATWSAGISIAALVLAILSRAAVSADRSVRTCSIWLAGCGSLIFGVVGAIELLLRLC